MANERISNLNDGTPAQADDKFIITRTVVPKDRATSVLANSGTNQITMASVVGLTNIDIVSGSSSIPEGTTVISISGNVVTLSTNITASIASGTTLTFTPPSNYSVNLGSMANQNSNAVAITGGSASFTGTVTGSNLSGTNTGDQTTTPTGDVTGSGMNSVATTISPNAVTYSKIQQVAAKRLLGNPSSSTANVQEVSMGPGVDLNAGALSVKPIPGRVTNGTTTIAITDFNTSLTSNDSSDVTYFLPSGLPSGFKFRSYQGAAGQINYVPSMGASIVGGNTFSKGPVTNGFFVDVENIGNDSWIITGNAVTSPQSWSLVGPVSVREGESLTYLISYPDISSYTNGASIQIAEGGVSSSGLDKTLVQAINDLCGLDSFVTFDGVNIITVKPGARNPLPLAFFATPNYTSSTNRSVTLTISNPTFASIANASVTTTIIDASKPVNPAALFATINQTTDTITASGTNQMVMLSVADLKILQTVTGSSNIPAQTWITAINSNTRTITLSNNTTASIASGTVLNFKDSGMWFDFSTAADLTVDGSNNVSVAADKVNGYTITQPTLANRPVYTANSLNSLGGLTFNGSKWINTTVNGQITKTTASTVSSGNSIGLNNATSLTTGMLVSAPGIPSNTTITAIAGSTITLSANITSTINNGATLKFTAVGVNHPLVSLLDTAGQKYTIFLVSRLTSSASTLNYAAWDSAGITSNITIADGSGSGFQIAQGMSTESSAASILNRNHIWHVASDGNGIMVRKDSQRIMVPATLTADWTSGTSTITVDDTSGVFVNMTFFCDTVGASSNVGNRVTAIVSSTQLTVAVAASATVPSGTKLTFHNYPRNRNPLSFTPQQFSQEFSLGSAVHGLTPFNGIIYEMIVVPRLLSIQEWRGINLYLTNKWSTTLTKATSASAAAGASTIVLVDVNNIYQGQVISTTTGIAAGTTVVKVNTSTNVVTLDTPITSAGVTNGQTLTFRNTAFKAPKYLDSTQYRTVFRDDFYSGVPFSNGSNGWQPYYGTPSNPGVYNSAYGANGRGSANNLGYERQWYLDVFNWQPWLKYNPFSYIRGAGNETGTAIITASPVASEIASQIGYYLTKTTSVVAAPGDTTLTFSGSITDLVVGMKIGTSSSTTSSRTITAIAGNTVTLSTVLGSGENYPIGTVFKFYPSGTLSYTYTSGYAKSTPMFINQYGYYEARIKCPPELGSWPAFWLSAVDGVWPPEIDIIEAYGAIPGFSLLTTHSNVNFAPNTYVDHAISLSDIQYDQTAEYAIFGADVTPTTVDFYINRELVGSLPTRWDQHTYWYMQFNLAVINGADNTTPMKMYLDHVAVMRKNAQAPTISGSTQSETTALVNAMTSTPSGPRQTLINTLISSLKSYRTSFNQTLWDALDFLFIPAAHDAQAARINWKNPAQIGTLVGTPVFVTDRGYTGTRNVNYINTGINLSTAGYQLVGASNHIGGWCANATSSNSFLVGTTSLTLAPNSNGVLSGVNLSNNTNGYWTMTIPNSPSNGYYVGIRNQYKRTAFRNGALLNATAGNAITVSLDNANIHLANGNVQVQVAHGGVYLSPDDVEYLYLLFGNYLRGIGAIA